MKVEKKAEYSLMADRTNLLTHTHTPPTHVQTNIYCVYAMRINESHTHTIIALIHFVVSSKT